MPRRNSPPKRKVTPDAIFHSEVVTQMINRIMVDGKRGPAERIMYGALRKIESDLKNSAPLTVLKRAINNVCPVVEVKSRRVGGSTYQVPIEVSPARGLSLALRWIINFSRSRSEKNMTLKLAGEIMDAAGDEGEEGRGGESRGRGGAVKKREDTHKMAEANKAFSHYRW